MGKNGLNDIRDVLEHEHNFNHATVSVEPTRPNTKSEYWQRVWQQLPSSITLMCKMCKRTGGFSKKKVQPAGYCLTAMYQCASCSGCFYTMVLAAYKSMPREHMNLHAGVAGKHALVLQRIAVCPSTPPRVPPHILEYLNEDPENPLDWLMMSGGKCQSSGLGVGASVYYRRVVEGLVGRILQDLLHQTPEEYEAWLKGFETEKEDGEKVQGRPGFKAQINKATEALGGPYNRDIRTMLNLLYKDSSDGVHAMSDEEALVVAGVWREALDWLINRCIQTRAAPKLGEQLVGRINALRGQRHADSD